MPSTWILHGKGPDGEDRRGAEGEGRAGGPAPEREMMRRTWLDQMAEETGAAAERERELEKREEEEERQEREALRRIRQRIAQESPDGSISRARLRAIVLEETAAFSAARRARIEEEVAQYLSGGLGPLQPYMDDPEVTEILVNRPDQVFIEKAGRLVLTPVRFRDDEEVLALATRIAGQVGRRLDLAEPYVDARIPRYGARFHAEIPPIAVLGTLISIRKFPRAFTFDELVEKGAIPDEVADALRWAVRRKLNVVISGGTSSGKTTLLNALTGLMDPGERVVIVEDAAELQPQLPHVVRLEARPPSVEGKGEVTIRELVRNALRVRPDRLIVGESRGPEAFDMLVAMNTGHPGSATTIHANSPREAITRLEGMMLMAYDMPVRAIRQQIGSALHLIVQTARVVLPDGRVERMVTHVSTVLGFDEATGDVRVADVWCREVAPDVIADVPPMLKPLADAGRLAI
ncbi:MAG: CpaF family protein [Bacillota bacterium]|nr:CpaF family protein [Bacillota bacterium]